MPDFTNRQGQTYRTEVPSEMVRLKAQGYTQGDTPVPTIDEQRFHPGIHNVDEVLEYLAEHPEDADRVVSEEKAGKARKAVVGDSGS